MILTILPKLFAKQNLTSDEIAQCFQEMMTGAVTDTQISDFLLGLHVKGETVEEIEAAVKAIREKGVKFQSSLSDLVDTCGTGGDGAATFNISTAAALIAAGAGAHVAKHGNRSVSSQTGSADVLEALGVKVEVSPDLVKQTLEKTGFGFMFAPIYHPAMKFVAGARRALGIRTIFNLIGPLANPAGAKRQLIGVWDPRFLEIFGQVLLNLGTERALIVRGNDGLDEMTLTTTTEVCELGKGQLKSYTFDPRDLGLNYCEKSDLQGGDAQANARIIEAILKGKDSAKRDVAALNAAAVLYVAGIVSDLKTGLAKANEAIDSGNAFEVLEHLRKITNG
jgi:anthranilate phosphoribosyltransferase